MKVKIKGLTTLGSENKLPSIKALRGAANIPLYDAKATVDVLNGGGIVSNKGNPQFKVKVNKNHSEFTNFEQYFKFEEITRQLKLWHCAGHDGRGYLVLASTKETAKEKLETYYTVAPVKVVDIWEVETAPREGQVIFDYKMV